MSDDLNIKHTKQKASKNELDDIGFLVEKSQRPKTPEEKEAKIEAFNEEIEELTEDASAERLVGFIFSGASLCLFIWLMFRFNGNFKISEALIQHIVVAVVCAGLGVSSFVNSMKGQKAMKEQKTAFRQLMRTKDLVGGELSIMQESEAEKGALSSVALAEKGSLSTKPEPAPAESKKTSAKPKKKKKRKSKKKKKR